MAFTALAKIMGRRKKYTKVKKHGFVRPTHVEGMGDRVFRGFQCLNGECTNFILVEEESLTPDFEILCPVCHFRHAAGEVSKLYDYELRDERDGRIIETGSYELLHVDYVFEAERFKYCIVCSALKPLHMFDRHQARGRSGRQGECRLCKKFYNSIKNQTRLAEQHREASQKRRLYTQFEGGKLDLGAVYKRFGSECFKCGKNLSADLESESLDAKMGNLDHTLPVFYLWPLTTGNATLLCKKHNAEKAEKWPGVFYKDKQLRRLAALTGIDYKILVGPAMFSPEALKRLRDPLEVQRLFEKFARYPDELLRLRNRILLVEGFDFLEGAGLSADWTARADALMKV